MLLCKIGFHKEESFVPKDRTIEQLLSVLYKWTKCSRCSREFQYQLFLDKRRNLDVKKTCIKR